MLVSLLLLLVLCVALYLWAASPRNPTEAPAETPEATSAHTDTSVGSAMETSHTPNTSGSSTIQNTQSALQRRQGPQAQNLASNNPPRSPRDTRLSQVNDLQELIDKQKAAVVTLKHLRAESKKASTQLTKASKALPEESDLEERNRLLKNYLHRLEKSDTAGGDDLEELKAKIHSEFVEMSEAMTGFEQHSDRAAQLFQELEESA